jgi:hypothetical protein
MPGIFAKQYSIINPPDKWNCRHVHRIYIVMHEISTDNAAMSPAHKLSPAPRGRTYLQLRKAIHFWLKVLVIAAIPCISRCLFTAHSFNHGRLLNPGETLISLGTGGRTIHYVETEIDSDYVYDTIAFEGSYVPVDTSRDTLYARLLTASLDYRLGILRTYPLGRGLECGFHLELPLVIKKGAVYGSEIPVLEFGLRTGLPSFPLYRSICHHNIGIGWSIGQWVDNGWFAEYAISCERARVMPYIGGRVTLGPSLPLEQGEFDLEGDFFNGHNRTLIGRITAGASISLPRLPILPDFITPELCVLYPNYTNIQPAGFGAQMGLRWLNGF